MMSDGNRPSPVLGLAKLTTTDDQDGNLVGMTNDNYCGSYVHMLAPDTTSAGRMAGMTTANDMAIANNMESAIARANVPYPDVSLDWRPRPAHECIDDRGWF